MNKELLTPEEIAYLSICYLKLKSNPTYQKMSKKLHDWIDNFLTEELIKLKKTGYIVKDNNKK